MSESTVCPAGNGPTHMDLPLKLAIARAANGISPASLAQAWVDWLLHLIASPSKQVELTASVTQKTLDWLDLVRGMALGDGEDVVKARPQDKRFTHREWDTPFFRALAQAFLLQEQWWAEATHGLRGVSPHHEELAAFMARQILDTASPSNFPLTNPQVIQETIRTGGQNLVQGWQNWWHDAVSVATGGKPRGVEAYVPGQSVAITPGQVVMRNGLVELIQYEPTTKQVDREPVLIIPSWIMKYYILDLTPDDSLVRYLVGQGHTVFAVSWRNPGSGDAGLGMDDYLRLGVLDTIAQVRRIRKDAHVHAMGYCLGGTLLAMGAAALARRGEHPFKTLSLLAAQVDFSEPGELGLFIDESQLSFLEDIMAEHGYLDGPRMAGAFQLINSKDLVWSKLVHEYLMGASTPMTALRAWNADATRMPARMHAEYLRHLYLHNQLAQGLYRFEGHALDLREIRVPLFVVGTERDHVSPWRSVYKIHQLVDAPVTMVLTSGGHNVGIVNPPEGPAASAEASYRMAQYPPRQAPDAPQAWFDAARSAKGSWWPAWSDWLHRHSSGRRVNALRPSSALHTSAPGTYVLQD